MYNIIDYKQKNGRNNNRQDIFSLRIKKSLSKKEISYRNFNSMYFKNSNNSKLVNVYLHKRENLILTPKIKRNKNNIFSLRKNIKSKFNSSNNKGKKLFLKYLTSKAKNLLNNKIFL